MINRIKKWILFLHSLLTLILIITKQNRTTKSKHDKPHDTTVNTETQQQNQKHNGKSQNTLTSTGKGRNRLSRIVDVHKPYWRWNVSYYSRIIWCWPYKWSDSQNALNFYSITRSLRSLKSRLVAWDQMALKAFFIPFKQTQVHRVHNIANYLFTATICNCARQFKRQHLTKTLITYNKKLYFFTTSWTQLSRPNSSATIASQKQK